MHFLPGYPPLDGVVVHPSPHARSARKRRCRAWLGTEQAALLWAALVVSLLPSGCQSKPAVAPPPPTISSSSVRPGINAEYLKADLDVSQWVERFEREGREIYEHRARIVDVLKLRPGMAVADVGAGSGLFTLLFAEAVGPHGRVYAVDLVPGFLAHIDRRCQQAGVRNVQTLRCTERSVELPAHSVDRIFICDTYHHFEYPAETMASIHRALRPGGELVLVEFKRIPGTSEDWILNHVRAGQEVFTAEILAAGFKRVASPDLLKDNYIIRFRKVGR